MERPLTRKRSGVATWLERALADADEEKNLKWRVVVVHHGLWSSGPHGNNKRLHDAGIAALLAAHKVDLVISGHDHIYERGWGDGLAYVVSGGGGAPTYKIKSMIPQARRTESVRHFVDVAVNGTSLQLVATRSDGSVIERCGLGKGLGWDCDPGATPAAPPKPSSRCACDVLGARPHGSTSPIEAIAAVAVAAAFGLRRRRSDHRLARR